MMEKNVALKYWREVVSTIVYTLNRVQIKKDTHGMVIHLILNILKYLDVSVIYLKSLGMEILMQK